MRKCRECGETDDRILLDCEFSGDGVETERWIECYVCADKRRVKAGFDASYPDREAAIETIERAIARITEWQAEADAKLSEARKRTACGCTDAYCEHEQLRDAKIAACQAEQESVAYLSVWVKRFIPPDVECEEPKNG